MDLASERGEQALEFDETWVIKEVGRRQADLIPFVISKARLVVYKKKHR